MYLKKIPTDICIREYIITFTYETRKGYIRDQQRLIRAMDNYIAEKEFNKWGMKMRAMFNVKILNIEEIEKNKEYIVL